MSRSRAGFSVLFAFTVFSFSLQSLAYPHPKWAETFGEILFGWAPKAQVSRVLDFQGEPIANAEILIGDGLGNPFADNHFFTDANGEFASPAQWAGELSVTIMAPGFVRTTFLAQRPGAHIFQLRFDRGTPSYELAGQTTGHPVVNGDGWADFGLVLPAMTKAELVSFDINAAISPKTDEMDVVGNKVNVPSNVAIPKQQERYFINVTLSKPRYHIDFSIPGKKHLSAIQGKFPFKSVVDKFRAGKQFYELINDFTIMGGGLYEIDLSAARSNADLPTNKFAFDVPMTARVPSFSGDQVLMAAALGQTQGYFYPTDLKTVASGASVTLNTLRNSDPLFLAVLKNKADQKGASKFRMSAALSPFAAKQTPVLLPLIQDPKLIGSYTLEIPAVKAPAGLSQVGQFLSLSAEGRPVWDVYGAAWAAQVELPEIGLPSIKQTRQWSVLLLASDRAQNVDLGPSMFEAVTHATQSSVIF